MISPVAIIAGILIALAVAWMMGNRTRLLLFGVSFGGLGYYAYQAWGELPAMLAWLVMGACLYFAVVKTAQSNP